MFDFDALVQLSAQCCMDAPKTIEVALTTRGLNARRKTALCVTDAFPEFRRVVDLIDKTCARYVDGDLSAIGEKLVEEYLAMQGFVVPDSPLMDNVDFLALMVGMSGFMERFESPENNGARLVVARLQACSGRLCGEAQCAMVSMGLWFADFGGFRDAVVRQVGAG